MFPEIKITEDGSPTLIDPVSGDSYHSMRGAMGESEHVFIENGLRYVLDNRIVDGPVKTAGNATGRESTARQTNVLNVLEVGFGSGLNALLTAVESEKQNITVNYTAIEKYPVTAELAATIDYGNKRLFDRMHTAEWDRSVVITEFFNLLKIETALQNFNSVTTFDLVYFDAFAYDTQPEMWSCEIFTRLASVMASGAILVTYSAKGVVKQNLRDAGFEVHRLRGALGKRHMLRAIKI